MARKKKFRVERVSKGYFRIVPLIKVYSKAEIDAFIKSEGLHDDESVMIIDIPYPTTGKDRILIDVDGKIISK